MGAAGELIAGYDGTQQGAEHPGCGDGADIPFPVIVRRAATGSPARRLYEEAISRGAAMIVSVSEGLLHGAACPMIVVARGGNGVEAGARRA